MQLESAVGHLIDDFDCAFFIEMMIMLMRVQQSQTLNNKPEWFFIFI